MKRSSQVLWMGVAVFTLGVIGSVLYMSHLSRGAGDVNLMFPKWSQNHEDGTAQSSLTGNGKVVKQSYALENFDKIYTTGHINLHVKNGEHYQVEIAIDENLQKHLQVAVEKGELHIAPEKNTNFATKTAIDVNIVLPHLSEMHLGGETALQMENIKSDKLTLVMGGENTAVISGELNQCILTLGGKSEIAMSLNNNHSLKVINGGQGKLTLSGNAKEFTLNNGGQISIQAKDFIVKSADISGAGVTDITLHATDKIKFNTVGVSNLHYFGNPKIINSTLGDVNITKEGE